MQDIAAELAALDGMTTGDLVSARCFASGGRLAVVATQSAEPTATARLRVPGFVFRESDVVDDTTSVTTADGLQTVQVGREGVAVLIYEKQ